MFSGLPPVVASKPEKTVFVYSVDAPPLEDASSFPIEADHVAKQIVSHQRRVFPRMNVAGRVCIPLSQKEMQVLEEVKSAEQLRLVSEHAIQVVKSVFRNHLLNLDYFDEASDAYFHYLYWQHVLAFNLQRNGFNVRPMHSSEDRPELLRRKTAFEFHPRFSDASALAEANARAIQGMASSVVQQGVHFCIVPREDAGKFAKELRDRGLKVVLTKLNPLRKKRVSLLRPSAVRRKLVYALAWAARGLRFKRTKQ